MPSIQERAAAIIRSQEAAKRQAEQTSASAEAQIQAEKKARQKQIEQDPSHQQLLQIARSQRVTDIMYAVWQKWHGFQTATKKVGFFRKTEYVAQPAPFHVEIESESKYGMNAVSATCDFKPNSWYDNKPFTIYIRWEDTVEHNMETDTYHKVGQAIVYEVELNRQDGDNLNNSNSGWYTSRYESLDQIEDEIVARIVKGKLYD